jgi:uncharacterized membrane protein YdjX (TVP38/TMEM64 family)
MTAKKLALAGVIATVITLYFLGGGEKYLGIHMYQDLFERSPLVTATVFFVVFFVGTSCSLPITAVLAVASGIIFGVWYGFVMSSLATTMGGVVSFFSTRYIFNDFIRRRFPAQIEIVNKGIEKEGALYLFGLRMIPVIPFWTLNMLMGLTSMRVSIFALATLFGMMPVLLIFTYTGSQLGEIEAFSISAVFTPGVILSLVLLAGFPLLAKALLGLTRRLANRESN